MQYISSDTNVWLDFAAINCLALPFRLSYTYLMNQDAIEDEFLSPPDLKDKLLEKGLRPTELTEEEFFLAEGYGSIYPKLSIYDRTALAIAKCRGFTLLSGDKALRNAAQREKVSLLGTIGILDQLWDEDLINRIEYESVLKDFQAVNGSDRRLPANELEKRLNQLRSK